MAVFYAQRYLGSGQTFCAECQKVYRNFYMIDPYGISYGLFFSHSVAQWA